MGDVSLHFRLREGPECDMPRFAPIPPVIPAKAGIQFLDAHPKANWLPACAGMTAKCR